VLALVVLAIPVGLGILLRDGYEGVLAARTFIPNLSGALLLFFVAVFALRSHRSSQRALYLGYLGIFLSVFLATDRIFFPIDARTSYFSSDAFWAENSRCFTKGGVTTAITGLWLSFCVFVASSWPSRRWRFLFSAAAGASGVVMLGFHCDSSSVGHVLISHLGQGLVLGALVFVLQQGLFRLGLKRAFPALSSRLKDLHRVG
jgi:hypothetical protein